MTVWIVSHWKGKGYTPVAVYDNEEAARTHGKNINKRWGLYQVDAFQVLSL